MIKIILSIVFIVSGCISGPKSFEWVDSLPQPWTLEEKDFEFYLSQFHERYPDFYIRLKALNLWRIGTPYGLYCLGEESGEDIDPIIRHDSSDCTVHVLTTLAFAKSSTYEEARINMVDIHYKPNQENVKLPSYDLRWHFTSDRILNHPLTVDITSSLVDSNKTKDFDIQLNKKQNGQFFLDIDWTSKESIKYIPTNNVDIEMLSSLPEICGVAFVKENYFKLGIAIAHEGYIIDQSNLVHASSEFKKTVEVDFIDYLRGGEKYRFDGVMFFEIKSI